MAEENRVHGNEKRKLDDFTALYNLDTSSTARGLVEHESGTYTIFMIRLNYFS